MMTQIEQTVQAIRNEFRFNENGQAFVSIRGAARLAGVSDAGIVLSFQSAADLKPRPLAEFLIRQGFDATNLESFSTVGIPDTALSLILEYFGYECQQRYRTEEAKACFRAFSTIGIRAWLQCELGYRQQQANGRPFFYERLLLFKQRTGRIPSGYFCIFEETTNLVGNLEHHGYNLPDDAIIDISIGKCFCKFLRDECGIEPNDVCLQYPHWYPGQSHPVSANLYPLNLLEIFRNWLDKRYYSHHIEKYFKTRKDTKAIEAVRKFLGLLPAA